MVGGGGGSRGGLIALYGLWKWNFYQILKKGGLDWQDLMFGREICLVASFWDEKLGRAGG